MALANNALTTLAAAKTYAGITGNTDDGMLTMLINAATNRIEAECHRTFAVANYTETLPGGVAVTLSHWPVLAVGNITDGNTAIANYAIDSATLTRADGAAWGGPVEVYYRAGYYLPADASNRTLPDDVELACQCITTIRYNMRGSEHVKSEQIGPLRADYHERDIPPFVAGLLSGYRRVQV